MPTTRKLVPIAFLLAACSGPSDPGADAMAPDTGAMTDASTDTPRGNDGGATDGAIGDSSTTQDSGTTNDASMPVGMLCTSPTFMTSDPNGGWSTEGYYVHNNMWNDSAGLGPETLYACSYHSWYVTSNQTDNMGAVKTYPNVHVDYADVPISSYHSITSTFAEQSPHVGIYNVAYDIWLNGIASNGSTEIMIWTENFHQVPAGDMVATAMLGGRTYDVWTTTDHSYIAFVPTAVVTSGSIDLLELFNWTMSRGWLRSDSTLGQIDFGVEIVSTGGSDATWQFTDFSITTN